MDRRLHGWRIASYHEQDGPRASLTLLVWPGRIVSHREQYALVRAEEKLSLVAGQVDLVDLAALIAPVWSGLLL
ncbi:MAG: hypothetical protein IAF00_07805 [Phycisphaerales bacterium]|nr:hypothetical protein [Phycisphaerales bacterium]